MGELINGRTPEEIDANALLDGLQNTVTLNTLRDAVYQDAVAHGLWERTDYIVKLIMQAEKRQSGPVHSGKVMREWAVDVISREVEELEIVGENEEAYTEELADVIIAALSVAGYLGIDIDAAVKRKMEVNRARPWKHGKENT